MEPSKILPKEKWQAKLNEVFYNATKHTNSRDSLFRAVREFGIPRSYVDKFIRAQPDWQTHQKIGTAKNTPTLQRSKPGYVQMDGMDIKKLGSPNIKDLLNFVDVYSRKAWSFALSNTTTQSIISCLEKLKEDYPFLHTIQSDNAQSFSAEAVENWMEKNNIKHVFSSVANPTTNAYVERFNGRIKKALYSYKQKTGKDPIPHLDEFVESFNLTPNATTKVVPELAILDKYKDTIAENVSYYNANKNISKGPQSLLQIGDKVRVALNKAVFGSTLKNQIQEDKGYMPKWSFDLYEISKIYEPQSEFAVIMYGLKYNKDWDLSGKKFQRHDLLKVDSNTSEGRHVPKHELYDFKELYKEKRGVGAPRKNPIGPKGPPKKRGRKAKPIDPDAPIKEKKPRGRPKKVESKSLNLFSDFPTPSEEETQKLTKVKKQKDKYFWLYGK